MLLSALAGLTGMGLGFGIMAYEALVNEVSYTGISWALIAPVWILASGFCLLGLTRAREFFFPALLFAGLGGTYFGDVYGQLPALVLIGLSILVIAEDWRTGGTNLRRREVQATALAPLAAPDSDEPLEA